jgi:hypothetical protein
MDHRQILGVVGALLLLGLLGSELSERRSAAIFFNKSVAKDLRRLPGTLEVLLAGHGGEGESGDFIVRVAAILPASLGGEGGWKRLVAPRFGDEIQLSWLLLFEGEKLHFKFLSGSQWRQEERRRWSCRLVQTALAFA